MHSRKYLTEYKYSPYASINSYRIKNPKFIFKVTKKLILNLKKKKDVSKICDLGCANGELIFFLKNFFKETEFYGYDMHAKFIHHAKKLFLGEKNIFLFKKNFFLVKSKFNVVTCLGTATTFSDIKELLSKIISLLSKNGIAIIDGIFNKYDCDVVIKFKDNSKKELNFWNRSINIHSQKTIRSYLQRFKNVNFEFKEYFIDTSIKKKVNKPHSHWWTELDKNNNFYLTNGLMLKKNPSFLIIKNNR